jgi:hypothetical protein
MTHGFFQMAQMKYVRLRPVNSAMDRGILMMLATSTPEVAGTDTRITGIIFLLLLCRPAFMGGL